MEAICRAKFQRYGPRKVNQVCEQIRGKSVNSAQAVLPSAQRAAVLLVEKTLRSAAANLAIKLGKPVDLGSIYVKSAWVGHGPMQQMKRVKPAPQGRAMMFKRKVCHLTIVVSDDKKDSRKN
jgi:large subunit ribosomal protein L22